MYNRAYDFSSDAVQLKVSAVETLVLMSAMSALWFWWISALRINRVETGNRTSRKF